MSLAISGTSGTAMKGQTVALAATATYSTNGTADVTSLAAWSTSNASVATVAPTGVVTMVGAGEVDITATYSGLNASVHLRVTAVTAITISGVGNTATVLQTAALTATATLSDNSTLNVTAQAAWTSSNQAVATVSAAGVVTFVAPGDVDIAATFGGVGGSVHVTVPAVFYNLTGIVTDAGDNRPVGGIVVAIQGGQDNGRMAVTDGSGAYLLRDVAAGAFTVQFSSPLAEYVTATRAVTLLQNERVDIALTRTALPLPRSH